MKYEEKQSVPLVDCVSNVTAHAQKPDFVFQRNGRVHLNRRGCQFSRLLAVGVCGSADSDCIDRVPTYSARLLAKHSIRIFPLHFPSRALPCAIRFRTRYNVGYTMFRGSVKSTGYPLHLPVSPSLLLPCVTVCHQVLRQTYKFRGRANLYHN